jgi:predicted dehydrogenase
LSRSDGMNYAPQGKPQPVCKKGEFVFSVIGLNHGHIYGMCNGLIEAGAVLKSVYDLDEKAIKKFTDTYANVKIAGSKEEILNDQDIIMIASATITSERGPLGMQVLESGKDFFVDKAPFTTLGQLEIARLKTASTGKKYMVYYSERLHVESSVFAEELINDGAIGKVIQVLGLGPHRLNPLSRPEWFFERNKYGGILCDIGSHQIEQYLTFAKVKEATVAKSHIANVNHPQYPELEDFGEVMLVGDNGATNYFRVDWFTPEGLGSWGDGRTIILGTNGYIEIRKYIDIGRDNSPDHLYLVNNEGENHIHVQGKIGYPYFGKLILDCLNRTENAMTQTHAFKASELSLIAQDSAVRIYNHLNGFNV